MKAYLLFNAAESHRFSHLDRLIKSAPFPIETIDAIFPALTPVPFQQRLLELAFRRTGYPMVAAELGCLLGHRKIWRAIVASKGDPQAHHLILESDSQIHDVDWLARHFDSLTKGTDLFFWGAFDGRMKLFSSLSQRIDGSYRVGEPLINSLYCTYGYSITPKTAALLLRKTAQISYPVDHFKRYFLPGEICIRGILPQLISGINSGGSQTRPSFKATFYSNIFDRLIDIKNDLLTRFR